MGRRSILLLLVAGALAPHLGAEEAASGTRRDPAKNFDLPDRIELVCPEDCDSAAEAGFSMTAEGLNPHEILEMLTVMSDGVTFDSEIDLSAVAVDSRVSLCPWDCLVSELADRLGLEVKLEGLKATLKLPEKPWVYVPPKHIEVACPRDCKSEALVPFGLSAKKAPVTEILDFLERFSEGIKIVAEVELAFTTCEVRGLKEPCCWDCLLQDIADRLGLEIELDGLTATLKVPD